MKSVRIAAMVASTMSLAACASIFVSNDAPLGVARPISKDYASTQDDHSLVKAFVYGKRTVLDFGPTPPSYVAITDDTGSPVPFEREGRYFRLNRQVDNFTVSTTGRTLSFVALKQMRANSMLAKADVQDTVSTRKAQSMALAVAAPVVQPQSSRMATGPITVAPAAVALSAPAAIQQAAPMVVAQAPVARQAQAIEAPRTVAAALAAPQAPQGNPYEADLQKQRQLAQELAQIRQELQQLKQVLRVAAQNPNSDRQQLQTVVAQVNELQGKLVTSSNKIVQITFKPGSYELNPAYPQVKALVAEAHAADKVILRGRTDANVEKPEHAQIALNRALATRQYLVANGVPSSKIAVSARGSGDFIASNDTPEGRAKNRRVEIELVQNGLKHRVMDSVKLAQQ